MKMLLATTAIAALCLSACSPSAPAADGAATGAPETAAAPAAAPAGPMIDGPVAGKWRMTINAMGMAMPPQDVCYEKQVSIEEAQKMQQDAKITCSEQSFKKEGAGYIGHSVCTSEVLGKPMTITSDTKVMGDFSSKYTMEMTTKMDPPPMAGMEEQKTSIVAERLGECDPPKPAN